MPGTVLIDPLLQPELWRDAQTPTPDSPPASWEALDDDDRYYFGGVTLQTVGVNRVDYIGPGTLPNQLGFAWEIIETSATAVLFRYIDRNGDVVSQSLGTAVATGTIVLGPGDYELDPEGTNPFRWWITDTAGQATNAPPITRSAVGSCDVSYNCDCEVDANAKTLAELRVRLLRRTGYAMQASNPPAGVAALYNDYLFSAQEYLYRRYKALQTKRFYSWRLEEGVRYYGIRDNAQCCDVKVDRYRIEGAWIQDPGNTWWPLVRGISPTFYTLDQNLGWPNYYEVRQCIEVFPAPQAGGYKLWIKGNFELAPFTADDDTTTIDAEPVFLWAMGLAKSHKGDRDAGLPTPGAETGYYGMAIRYVKDLIASAHGNTRYIPGTAAIPVATPPVMVEFDS
jgi:hypothetical protein